MGENNNSDLYDNLRPSLGHYRRLLSMNADNTRDRKTMLGFWRVTLLQYWLSVIRLRQLWYFYNQNNAAMTNWSWLPLIPGYILNTPLILTFSSDDSCLVHPNIISPFIVVRPLAYIAVIWHFLPSHDGYYWVIIYGHLTSGPRVDILDSTRFTWYFGQINHNATKNDMK